MHRKTRLWAASAAVTLMIAAAILLGSALPQAGAQTAATAAPTEEMAVGAYPNARLLVSAAWLDEHLDDPTLRIIDMRNPDAYAAGHIPGAVNVPVSAISATVNDIPLEFAQDEVQATLNAIGLTPETTAVLYDDLGMMNSARMFWTLEYVGHGDARVVDGGWNAWEAAGYATSTETPDITPTEYPLALDDAKLATADDVLAVLDDPDVVIVDARSPQEYSGEIRYAERGGHIPGAVLFTWLDALEGGDAVNTTQSGWADELRDPDVELLRPAEDLQRLLDARGITPDKTAIAYCQTLWRGAHVYFLLRLMGFEQVRGYDGSWAEWGNRADLPVVTGDSPR